MIVQRAIKEAQYDERRVGDISTVLNMYIDWEQLKNDVIESVDFLQTKDKITMSVFDKLIENIKSREKILNHTNN